MLTLRRLLLPALVLLAVPRTGIAAPTWIEVKTPHFTIISSGSERRAQTIAWEFEQVRAVVGTMGSWARVIDDRPVVVIAAGDAATLEAITKKRSTYGTLPDRVFLALNGSSGVSTPGVNEFYYAFSQYVNLAIGRSERPMPPWFRYGLLDIMANTSVRDGEVLFGLPIPWFVRTLRSQQRLPLRDLVAAEYPLSGRWPTDNGWPAIEPEGWLLTHMLMFGSQTPNAMQRIDDFLAQVRPGQSYLAAFEVVFGDPAALETQFKNYIAGQTLPFRRDVVDIKLDRERLPVRRLTESEATLALAAFDASRGLTDDAWRVLRARGTAGTPAAIDLEVQLLYSESARLASEGKREESGKKEIEAQLATLRAATAGSTSYYTYYRLASSRLDPTSLQQARTALTKSIELNPLYPPALIRLCSVEARLGDRDAARRRLEQALSVALTSFNEFQAAACYGQLGLYTEALTLSSRARTKSYPPAANQFAELVKQASAKAPTVPAPQPDPLGAVRAGGALPAPARLTAKAPEYPAVARAAEVQGVVILEAVIGLDGKVTDVRVLRSIPLLNAAAADAVRQWEFAPTVIDGKPVPVITTVTVNFAR